MASPVRRELRPAVIAGCIEGHTRAEIARRLDVCPSAITATIALPEVAAEISKGHAHTVRVAQGRISAHTETAVDALVHVMTDDRTLPGDRIKAAIAILDRGGVPARSTVEVAPVPSDPDKALSALASILSGAATMPEDPDP